MKKTLLTFVIAVASCSVYAQNTFPASGAVGIGTTSPAATLQVKVGSSYDLLTNTYTFDMGVNGAPGSWARAFRVVNSSGSDGTDGGAFGVYGNGTSPGYLYIAIPTAHITGYNSTKILVLNSLGNVGIGTKNPDQKLTVNGTIHASSVLVDTNVPAPDYVFNNDYKLPSIAEVNAYINKNHHLPDMPAAAEIEKKGLNLGEMNMALLKKVEELTLYMIEKDKQVNNLEGEVTLLKQQQKVNEMQQQQIDQLKQQLININKNIDKK